MIILVQMQAKTGLSLAHLFGVLMSSVHAACSCNCR
jgi:hypothetical protein